LSTAIGEAAATVLGEIRSRAVEVIGARDEIRLAVQLDQDSDFAVVVDVVRR
jgi:hypothetical protein